MPIKDWPEQERPREKLLSAGAAALSDAELLAIFLRTGQRGETAVDLARNLLKEFKGLRNLVDADAAAFSKQKGMGAAKYCQIQAAIELGRRYMEANLRRQDVLTCPEDTKKFLIANLRPHPHEVFACLFLDNRNRVIDFEKMFRGTIDSANVYPREVVKRALFHNAAAVILAHNHPSGVAEPSAADRDITNKLQEALKLIGVRVLDHFVVGDTNATSFAESGLL